MRGCRPWIAPSCSAMRSMKSFPSTARGRFGCASTSTASIEASRRSAWRPPKTHSEWGEICRELVARNGGGDQYLYLQVTRGGEFGRNHAWPEGLEPTIFGLCQSVGSADARPAGGRRRRDHRARLPDGRAAISSPRRSSPTCCSRNSPPMPAPSRPSCWSAASSPKDLPPRCTSSRGARFILRPTAIRFFPAPPAMWSASWRNGWASSAAAPESRKSSCAPRARSGWHFPRAAYLPVTRLDGSPVGDGKPGPLFRRMHKAFLDYVRELARTPDL